MREIVLNIKKGVVILKTKITKVSMVKYGESQNATGTLNSKGIAQVIKTAEFLKKDSKPGERVMIYASPRDMEVQTANIVKEEFGLTCKVQILPWLYKLEAGHIIVDNLMVTDFVEQHKGIYDHLIIIASTEHVEGWPSLITGNYAVNKVPNGHCVTIDHDGTLTYSKK